MSDPTHGARGPARGEERGDGDRTIADRADLKKATLRKAGEGKRRAASARVRAAAKRATVKKAAADRARRAERTLTRPTSEPGRLGVLPTENKERAGTGPSAESADRTEPPPAPGATERPLAATAGAGLVIGLLFGWRLARR